MKLTAGLAILLTSALPSFAPAADFENGGKIRFVGKLDQPKEQSGVAVHRDLLVVVPDEGARINLLRPQVGGNYQFAAAPQLLSNNAELDMEGVTSDGRHLYVLGSSSLLRKRIEEERTYPQNLQRIGEVADQGGRHLVWRLDIDKQGEVKDFDFFELSPILERDRVLAPFTKIPGKENGVDLEGIATKEGKLYFGCRGPVLRDNYVPIIVAEFGNPEACELRYITLGGRGVRDICAVDSGFLIIGGPVGDGDDKFPIYWWDGKDCLPGIGSPGGRTEKLGTIDEKKDKPEGLVVLRSTATHWNVLVVCDGGDQPLHLVVPRP